MRRHVREVALGHEPAPDVLAHEDVARLQERLGLATDREVLVGTVRADAERRPHQQDRVRRRDASFGTRTEVNRSRTPSRMGTWYSYFVYCARMSNPAPSVMPTPSLKSIRPPSEDRSVGCLTRSCGVRVLPVSIGVARRRQRSRPDREANPTGDNGERRRGADSEKRLGRDTLTTCGSLAPPRSCYYAHEVRTSQAECRGFESRLPLQVFLTLGATPQLDGGRSRRPDRSTESSATTLRDTLPRRVILCRSNRRDRDGGALELDGA